MYDGIIGSETCKGRDQYDSVLGLWQIGAVVWMHKVLVVPGGAGHPLGVVHLLDYPNLWPVLRKRGTGEVLQPQQ